MKWSSSNSMYMSLQREHDVSQFVIAPSQTKGKFLLKRKWIAGAAKGNVDYIGTFKSVDAAKEVAKLIREG